MGGFVPVFRPHVFTTWIGRTLPLPEYKVLLKVTQRQPNFYVRKVRRTDRYLLMAFRDFDKSA
jgi:hypothetical protein